MLSFKSHKLIYFIAIFNIFYSSHGYTESKYMISSFSTSVADQDQPVKQNILLACDRINGAVIKPGEIFSFNDTVGEGSLENGFAMGRVLYRDHLSYEAGGGLCQASSTIFNAFLLAGCAIIERHRHYQPVSYVPLGLDATIKFGKKDLRMKNMSGANLYIKASMNEKSLAIAIYSSKKPAYKFNINTEEEEISIPFQEERENIRQGIAVYVYRTKMKDDRVIENFLLYKDFYPPVSLR